MVTVIRGKTILKSTNIFKYVHPWDISTATLVQSFSVTAQDTDPKDVFFKPDGTKMYVFGNAGNDVNQYDLSTAWDISTASYIQSFAGGGSIPDGLFFKPDGTKMYLTGQSIDAVQEYNLSTPWDISTASFINSFSVSTQDTVPLGVFFRSDGLKMYISGSRNDSIYEYNLSTAWDTTTISYVRSFSVGANTLAPMDVFFKPDGTKMYVADFTNSGVIEYNLSTAWNISTAIFSQFYQTNTSLTTGFFFRSDGLKMYVSSAGADRIYEYNLG